MAVASAGPYASLHLAADKQPHQHPTTLFFTGQMPFLPPNQMRQGTDASRHNLRKQPMESWTHTCLCQQALLQLLQPFNGLFSRTTWVSRYQKGKTNLDFTGARDSEWQWHQLGHMHVCTSLQTDNHTSTPPLCFLQTGCPSCRPTNSVKALKAL